MRIYWDKITLFFDTIFKNHLGVNNDFYTLFTFRGGGKLFFDLNSRNVEI